MINFKKLELEEIKILENLAYEIWNEYSICFINQEQIDYMLKKFQSTKAILTQISNNYEYYFIQSNNENVGYFAIQPQNEKLFLSKLYIKKTARRKGIGQKALYFIIQKAKDYHLNSIELTVNKTNTNSINAYQKWGFQIKSSTIADIGNGFVMDDFILEYEINN